jgi:hypothetical protein
LGRYIYSSDMAGTGFQWCSHFSPAPLDSKPDQVTTRTVVDGHQVSRCIPCIVCHDFEDCA